MSKNGNKNAETKSPKAYYGSMTMMLGIGWDKTDEIDPKTGNPVFVPNAYKQGKAKISDGRGEIRLTYEQLMELVGFTLENADFVRDQLLKDAPVQKSYAGRAKEALGV